MLYQRDFYGVSIYGIGVVLLNIAAVLTLWSMLDYLKAAWPIMKGQN